MTERQSFDMQEQRQEIFRRDGYTCQNCGGSIYQFGNPQLAHRISQGVANIKRYGKAVIHHPLNMASVCSLRCNDAQNIGFSTKQADELAEKIKLELSK
jgi:5-methylcytosine-specific restriction endonuclease McrA